MIRFLTAMSVPDLGHRIQHRQRRLWGSFLVRTRVDACGIGGPVRQRPRVYGDKSRAFNDQNDFDLEQPC